MTQLKMLTVQEHADLEAARRAGTKKGSHKNSDYFPPGTGWFCPWLFDPDKWDQERFEKGLEGKSFLSTYYYRDWAKKRAPITVVTPNGYPWLIDAKSQGGEGWQITGEGNNLTATPSIVVPGYHSFLKDGIFGDDIEGRGPNGAVFDF